MPKFDFQGQFSMSKMIIFSFFFIEEYQFRSTFFVIDMFWYLTSVFKSLYFLNDAQFLTPPH